MSKVTKASTALRAVVKPERLVTQQGLAKELGCTQQAVSAWLKGLSTPDGARREKIEAMFQIPASDWDHVVPAAGDSGTETSDADDTGERSAAAHDDRVDTASCNGTEG